MNTLRRACKCHFSRIGKGGAAEMLQNQLIKLSNSRRINQRNVSICVIVDGLKCMFAPPWKPASVSRIDSFRMVRVVPLGYYGLRTTILRLLPYG